MNWRAVGIAVAGLVLLATISTIAAGVLLPHLYGEPNLSTPELLSGNWWHPVLRLGIIWLWLFTIVSSAVALLIWLISWSQRSAVSG